MSYTARCKALLSSSPMRGCASVTSQIDGVRQTNQNSPLCKWYLGVQPRSVSGGGTSFLQVSSSSITFEAFHIYSVFKVISGETESMVQISSPDPLLRHRTVCATMVWAVTICSSLPVCLCPEYERHGASSCRTKTTSSMNEASSFLARHFYIVARKVVGLSLTASSLL